MPTKYYQNVSKGMKVIEHTNFCIWTDAWLIAISPKPCRSGDKNINIFNVALVMPKGWDAGGKKIFSVGFCNGAPSAIHSSLISFSQFCTKT